MSLESFRRILLGAIIVAGTVALALYVRSCSGTAKPKQSQPTVSAPSSTPAPLPPERSAPSPSSFTVLLEKARALTDPAQRSPEFGRILREWLARDSAAALAYVRALPAGNERTQGLLMALTALGQNQPEYALALARELATTPEQHAIYSILFADWAEHDIRSATNRLSQVPPAGRENALRAVADTWSQRDPAAALAWAKALPLTDQSMAMESVIATLAEQDPLRAIELAQQSLAGPALNRTLSTALEKLTAVDPKAARAIVPLLPPGDVQTFAAFTVARTLAEQNPAEAIVWSKTLPAEETQIQVLATILDAWAVREPSSAARYVTEMPSGTAQQTAAERVARILGARDPQKAIAWVNALPTPATRDSALITVASSWAQGDPQAAADWASKLPAGSAREASLDGALSYWLLRDRPAVKSFVAALPADVQAHAAESVAGPLAQSNPLDAINWARSLQGEARDAALSGAFRRWQDNDPSAATAWLTTANLPPEMERRLQQKDR